MTFEVSGKVAIITGGTGDIGSSTAKELLRSGLKGVTLADVNVENSKKVLADINFEFGENRAIFVKTDVTNFKEFQEAFEKTISHFQQVDILINNAGILNDANWQQMITINVNGTVNGMLLGLENYIPKFRSGREGVIVNLSSIAGLGALPNIPIYCGTKFAIHGMSLSWGSKQHYVRTKVKVLAVCPNATETALLHQMDNRNLGEPYQSIFDESKESMGYVQTAEECAQQIVNVIRNKKSGTAWVIEKGEPAYEYVMPSYDSLKNI